MGKNNLIGEIPYEIGILSYLVALQLNGNMLQGNLPSGLQNCSRLHILDVGDNLLVGKIPLWLSHFFELMILVLRSNKLQGQIPNPLSNLSKLHVLDISHNNLTGPIPSDLGNLAIMLDPHPQVRSANASEHSYYYKEEIQVINKGSELTYYDSILLLITCIDLFENQLYDGIPLEIGNLQGLHTLNLSRNNLIGDIPITFGMLEQLESLDLSNNKLHGNIPNEMLKLSSMSTFIVYNNMLCGTIPTGGQFATFNLTFFSNNPSLCGFPLDNKTCKCGEKSNIDMAHLLDEEIEEESEIPWHWYVEWMASFATGFWGVFGILIVKRYWRRKYIQLLDEVAISFLDRLRGIK
ncbi:receptor-like protein EIX2 [Cryptomeria japonica]|uniref:receptor-like protein EIX2 n=1 Tax=Cryptomeria japonica TaxID=3369 RepID=UPI0027DA87D9|nr:receptor-like protein EIX2 [Cryptomeria japonica]